MRSAPSVPARPCLGSVPRRAGRALAATAGPLPSSSAFGGPARIFTIGAMDVPALAPAAPRSAPSARHCGLRGFSLVELLVVMSLLVVVSLLLLPGMTDFTARNRLVAVEADLAASLALARSEAAHRGLPVLLVAASGGSTGNAYAGGWRLVLDSNRNGSADSGETELRVREAIGRDLTLDGSSPVRLAATGYLDPATAKTFTLCARGISRGVSLTVTPTGQTDSASITTCS